MRSQPPKGRDNCTCPRCGDTAYKLHTCARCLEEMCVVCRYGMMMANWDRDYCVSCDYGIRMRSDPAASKHSLPAYDPQACTCLVLPAGEHWNHRCQKHGTVLA